MTLYLFTNDTEPGVSTCYDDCADAWPIFTAEEPLALPGSIDGELTLITAMTARPRSPTTASRSTTG